MVTVSPESIAVGNGAVTVLNLRTDPGVLGPSSGEGFSMLATVVLVSLVLSPAFPYQYAAGRFDGYRPSTRE
jgi:hypothetical protein